MDIARLVQELAPQAYVMNFTNPAGIITEAMQSVLGDRVLGICDTPSGLGRGWPGCSVWTTPGCRWTTWASTTWAGCGGCCTTARTCCPRCWPTTRCWVDGGGQGLRRRLAPHPRRDPQRVPVLLLLQPGRRAEDQRLGQTRGDFLARTQTEFFDTAQAAGEARPSCGARRWTRGAPATWPRPRAACRAPRPPTRAGVRSRPSGLCRCRARRDGGDHPERAGHHDPQRPQRHHLAGLPADAVVEVPTWWTPTACTR